MGLSKLLGCLCGKHEEEHSQPAVPVQYASAIEGKNPKHPHSPADSEDSFDSDAEFTKEKGLVRIPEPVLSIEKKKNRALIVASKGTYDLVHEEFPEMAHEKEVVIRNMATGLNPIDFKSVDYNFCLPEFPWITGREMAGVVEEMGEGVEGLRVGDRVWTSEFSPAPPFSILPVERRVLIQNTGTYYRDRRAGCFQTFVTVPAHTVLPMPSNLSYNQAACLGVAGLTAAMSLWCWLEVPMSSTSDPEKTIETEGGEGEWLLIWGGSAVTGQFATQIAVASGLNVIAVVSSKTKDLSETLGATTVVRDNKTEEEIVAEIRGIGGNNITRAIDLVGTKTANFCLQALSTSKPSIFAPLAMISSKAVVPENVRVETVEMKQFVLNEESRKYAVELNKLVEQGKLVLPSIEVLEGGLDIVQPGLDRIKRGDMGGKKLVVAF